MKTLILLLLLSPLFVFSQTKIGDIRAGGIVFKVTENGKHGLIITDTVVKDSATYDEAAVIAKQQKASLPTISDWQGGIVDLVVTGKLKYNQIYFWTADGQYPSSMSANAMTLSGNFSSVTFYRHTSKIGVLLIRKF